MPAVRTGHSLLGRSWNRTDTLHASLIALAVLLGLATFLDRDRPTTREQLARAGFLFRVFRADDVTRLRFERRALGGDEHYELLREGGAFRLRGPTHALADADAVRALLLALQSAHPVRALGPLRPAERERMGLLSPRVRVELAAAGATLRFALGAPVEAAAAVSVASGTRVGVGAAAPQASGGNAPHAMPPGHASSATPPANAPRAAYLEVEAYGDQPASAFVVAADLVATLDRSADAYQDPRLSLRRLEISELQSWSVGDEAKVQRAPSGTFRVGSQRADGDRLAQALALLSDLRATSFLREAPTGPATVVELVMSSGPLQLRVGQDCPTDANGRWIARVAPEPMVGCIARDTAERILQPMLRVADTHLLAVFGASELHKSASVEAVRLELGGKVAVDVERRGDGMHLRVPVDEQVRAEPSASFLGQLVRAEGRLEPQAPPNPGQPIGKLWVRLIGPARTDTAERTEQELTLYAQGLVRRADDGAWLRVEGESLALLSPDAPLLLRGSSLLSSEGVPVERLLVRVPSGSTFADWGAGFDWSLRHQNSTFVLEEPTALGADPNGAEASLRAVQELSCVRRVGSDRVSLGKIEARVEVSFGSVSDAGTKVERFAIGAASEDGYLVQLEGHDELCVLSFAQLQALLMPPIDRSALAWDVVHAPRFVLRRGGSVRELWTSGGARQTFRFGKGQGSAQLAHRLGEALAALRASAVAHLGAPRPGELDEPQTLLVEGYDEQGQRTHELRIGGSGKLADLRVYYARRSGIDAVYAVPRDAVDRILDLL